MKDIDKYLNEKMSKHKLADEPVTTMTYDMVVKDDTSINQEIKDYLAERGWEFIIPEQIIERYLVNDLQVEKDAPAPNTTAWKVNLTPAEACAEFKQAILAYNANHSLEDPMKFARGYAFAVSGNEYKALKVE